MGIAVVRTVRRVTVTVVTAFCLLVSVGCLAGDSCCDSGEFIDTVQMCCIQSHNASDDGVTMITNSTTCTSLCNITDGVKINSSFDRGCNLTSIILLSYNFSNIESSTLCNCTNELVLSCNSTNDSMNDNMNDSMNESMNGSTISPQVTITSLPIATTTSSRSPTTTMATTTALSTTTSTAMAEVTTVTSESAAAETSEFHTASPPRHVEPYAFTLWLWVALGVLLLLIIAVLPFVTVACCRRYHKRKESPTTMDIVSKWEDVPDESSDIKLVSMKSIGDDENKDGEKENNGDIAKSEETKKEDSEGEKEEKGDGDITMGTFGFPEVVVEPTAFKAENTGDSETEKKKGDGNEDNAADKKEQKEELSDKGPEKSVDESTTRSTGATICSTSADKQNATTEAVIAKDKQNTTESTSSKEVATIDSTKALVSGSGLNTSTDKTDQPASPTKQQALSTEASNASKEMSINAKVSTDTEPAATTGPQAQTTDVQPLQSNKPSDATGGLLSFDDMEKALELIVKGVGQDDSTQN